MTKEILTSKDKEADLTFVRIIELAARPISGNFDLAHLCLFHKHIFQDLVDFHPGQLRNPTPRNQDWVKRREIKGSSFLVCYSPMDRKAISNLEKNLNQYASRLKKIPERGAFVSNMAKLYSQIDYSHPFSDGNSRTARSFTRHLAKTAGYDLLWENIKDHLLLYVARDLAVNEIAMPHIRSDNNKRDAYTALTQLGNNPTLEDLLDHIIYSS
ncbi:Fic family protein [Xanthomonas arboricola]|uniref:Fic family protein n=1 Tax=Xanthomonas arboricola TaxID=56448 RepID=UPI000E0EFD6E|nr:Fic family protein [Xanthomonas arboricola]